MAFELAKGVHVPSKSLSDYIIFLAGRKKIGKTAFAAQFPDHYIMEYEPKNASHLHCRYNDIRTWAETMRCIELLEKSPGYAKTIIVDDVPTMYDMCLAYVCKKEGIGYPSDLEYGKGWNAVKREFESVIKRIMAIGPGVIFTAHTKLKDIETKSGKKFQRLESTLSGQASSVMDAITHLWIVMDYEKDGRVMRLLGDEYLKAGIGLEGHFLDPSGERLSTIPLGKSPQEAYANFEQAFHNQLVIGNGKEKQLRADTRNTQAGRQQLPASGQANPQSSNDELEDI